MAVKKSKTKKKASKSTKKTKKKTTKKTKQKARCTPKQLEVLSRNAFKTGESGNPNGRPKGSKNWKTIIKSVTEIEVSEREINKILSKYSKGKKAHFKEIIKENGGRISYKEAMIVSLVLRAVNGDVTAFNAILDRDIGKPKQTVLNTEQSYEDFLTDDD